MVSYVRGRGLRTLSDAEIVSRYLAGGSTDAIGQDANCPPDTVLYLVRRAGHQPRPRGARARHKVLPLDDAQICRLYRDGLSGPEIAERCGTTAATIYHRLRANNVPRRPAGKTMSAAARARRLRKEPP